MAIPRWEAEELVRRARAGNQSAMHQLLTLHRDRLRRMIAVRMDPRLAARMDPSDVLQEATAEAARRLPDFLQNSDCSFYPWLRKIAWERLVHVHRQHIHAQKRSVKRETGWSFDLPDQSVQQMAEWIEASSTSPSRRMVREELMQRVREALDQLAADDREVLVLRHLEQLPFKEVAAVLELSGSAVQSRYRRALERLHDLLSE